MKNFITMEHVNLFGLTCWQHIGGNRYNCYSPLDKVCPYGDNQPTINIKNDCFFEGIRKYDIPHYLYWGH